MKVNQAKASKYGGLTSPRILNRKLRDCSIKPTMSRRLNDNNNNQNLLLSPVGKEKFTSVFNNQQNDPFSPEVML